MTFKIQCRLFCNGAVAVLLSLLVTNFASAEPCFFSESWESYTNGVKPYGEWQLDKAGWGHLVNRGLNGSQCFLVPAKGKSRIRHEIDLLDCNDIVLQGWLYDSGETVNKSSLGFVEVTNSADALIRIGIGVPNTTNYAIVCFDRLQSEKAMFIDTGMPYEKGWHFMRLDISHDRTVTYRVWNAMQSQERTGQFGWVFDRNKLKYVVVGSILMTPGEVAWDDIKVGSLEQIGPPPTLPNPGQ